MKKNSKHTLEALGKIRQASLGREKSPETRLKLSLANKGKVRSEEAKNKISLTRKQLFQKGLLVSPNKGKSPSIQTRLKQSLAKRGDKSPTWKGGISKINHIIRESLEYRLWREAVFKRDNWSCVWCGHKGNVHADHIKRFADYPELRFAIDNGRTLCVPCHRTTETYGRILKII